VSRFGLVVSVRLVSGWTSVRYRFGSLFSSKKEKRKKKRRKKKKEKVVVCGHCLVTLSITFYRNIKMAVIAAHLNAEIILMVTV